MSESNESIVNFFQSDIRLRIRLPIASGNTAGSKNMPAPYIQIHPVYKFSYTNTCRSLWQALTWRCTEYCHPDRLSTWCSPWWCHGWRTSSNAQRRHQEPRSSSPASHQRSGSYCWCWERTGARPSSNVWGTRSSWSPAGAQEVRQQQHKVKQQQHKLRQQQHELRQEQHELRQQPETLSQGQDGQGL